MDITAEEMAKLSERADRAQIVLSKIEYRIPFYARDGNKEYTWFFEKDVDTRAVQKEVINVIRSRGFSVKYDKLSLLFGDRTIIIEW